MKKDSENFLLRKVVVVYWNDAASCDGWDSFSSYEQHTPMKCRTSGFLLESNKNYVTIISTESVHRQLNQAMSIPRAWVTRIQYIPDLLEEPKKKTSGKKKLDK